MATGYHPWRKQKIETHLPFWAVPLDRDKTGLVMWHKLRAYMPPGFRYNKQEQTFYLPAPYNSRIQIIQQAAGREQFQAARVRAIWIDEECPASQGGDVNFTEMLARKEPGVDLDITVTFTPLNGLDWSYRKLLDKDSPDLLKSVEVFQATIWDAAKSHGGWYTDEEIEEIVAKYPQHERKARLEGVASLLDGSLYFNRHAIEEAAARSKKESAKTGKIKKYGHSAFPVFEEGTGGLTIYRPPLKGHNYICGADPSGGVGRDWSVASVWDREDLVCVAEFASNRVDPDFFGAEICLPLGIYYNGALMVVESNNHGGTVLSQLRGRYPNLYVRQNWNVIDHKIVEEYGFRTDTRSRPRILDSLARCLRENTWTPTLRQLEELKTFVMKENEKIEAMEGYFDDAVMAAGIAMAVHFEQPVANYPPKSFFTTRISGDAEDKWMGV